MNFEISYNLAYLKEVFKYVLLPISIIILFILIILFVYSKTEKDHESEQYSYIINLWTYIICIILSAALFAVVLSFAISMHSSIADQGISHPIITIVYLTPLVPLAFLLSTSMRLTEIFVNHKRYTKMNLNQNNFPPKGGDEVKQEDNFPKLDNNINEVSSVEPIVSIPSVEGALNNVETKEELVNEPVNNFQTVETNPLVEESVEQQISYPEEINNELESIKNENISTEPIEVEDTTNEIIDERLEKIIEENSNVENNNNISEENPEYEYDYEDNILESKNSDDQQPIKKDEAEDDVELIQSSRKPIIASVTNKDKFDLKQKNLYSITSNEEEIELL